MALDKIRYFLHKPKKIQSIDEEVITIIKDSFKHSVRDFIHRNKTFSVDCIYCHATPGTIETSILELIQRKKEDRNNILNLGGGTGQVKDILAFLKFNVVNLDIEISNPDNNNIKFDLNCPEDLPFEDNYFDFILCQEVIEHIENPWMLFRKMKKILKKDGYIILTTPNIQSSYSKKIFNSSGYFHWFEKDNFSYHINAVPLWEIQNIISTNALIIEKIAGNGEYYFKKLINRANTLINDNECLIFIIKKIAN